MSTDQRANFIETISIYEKLPEDKKGYFEGFLLGLAKGVEKRGAANEEDKNRACSPDHGAGCSNG